ncbi:ABC transporter ATP-binding protein [Hoeflea poritis]|uniref:ABC transporter ATP-binding protein n=1 Tax=Hoeflea poritis TaxID=2993659 RepID=A0ABT4VVG6_9HYPH|nr:ABC transporter ATP-binding protein [Hoeflea poritis]MDA4848718.1 ABC transporter ATP-binding protein [Hoeflea poritis]
MRVQLKDIRKSYGSLEVVKGLNLDIAEGEFLVLLGESGCGKSTALRMIAGLETITEGSLMIGERNMTEVLPKYRNVAMVFQSYALYPHMTVAENIGYPLKLQKTPKAELQSAVLAAATKVHLEDYLERMPRQLSGGQRQRVALARAIVRTPSVFLMDEPLSNLDAKLRGAMRAELKRLQAELGITTVYVTHDQIEAMTLAHRVAVMDAGVLQQVAPPKEIYDNPATRFVARFIGSPAMNIVTGSVADGRVTVEEGAVPLEGYAPRERVSFGFRPEDCSLVSPESGMMKARVFSTEMTGNETIVTCEIGQDHVVVREDKDFDMKPDEWVGIDVVPEKARLFDYDSGKRVHT